MIDLPHLWAECPEPGEPSVSLPPDLASPTPSVSAGAIAASFSVSSAGSAIYAMQLDVVPGGRMQPSISIAYESTAGEGPIGMGFSLGELHSITRCPKTLSQDHTIEPVREKPGDALCMDGQRILPADPASANPAEWRTLPDTFSKIVADYAEDEGWDANRGPKSFQVFTKSGLILEFGTESTGLVVSRKGVIRS